MASVKAFAFSANGSNTSKINYCVICIVKFPDLFYYYIYFSEINYSIIHIVKFPDVIYSVDCLMSDYRSNSYLACKKTKDL